MSLQRTLATVFTLFGLISLGLVNTGCQLDPLSDDAGHRSFVRQIVPLLLGRPLQSADEGRVLVDLVQLSGRETVVRMLLREPEFRAHWTNVIAEQIQMQRNTSRKLTSACFGPAQRIGPDGDGGALAAWVRDHDLRDAYPGTQGLIEQFDPIEPFNFADLVQSALELDDLSVIYKAYMVPLVSHSGNFGKTVGQFFVQTYLNRDLGCTRCHNVDESYSNPPHTEYARTFPFAVHVDKAVLGCANCSSSVHADLLFGIFRQDIISDENFGDTRPWGMNEACGALAGSSSFEGDSTVVAKLAGIDTEYEGYPALIDRFDAGVRAIAQYGVPAAGSDPSPERAFAYMVAAAATEEVWKSVIGSPLTLTHGFARNGDQVKLHELLIERLLESDWSLADLIVEITTSGYFNRNSPEESKRSTPYALPPVIDPFTVPLDDPDVVGDKPCPTMPQVQSDECQNGQNGQGELVTRFTPVELFTHMHHALGWPAPKRFPDDTIHPSLEMLTSMESYLSDWDPGARDWGFQSLIAWEDAAGRCESPDGNSDWIDLLIAEIPAYDALHPESPATLGDFVRALKSRLVQTSNIDMGSPFPDLPEGTEEPPDPEPPGGPVLDLAESDPGGGGAPVGPTDEADVPLPPLPPTPLSEAAGIREIFYEQLSNPVSNIPYLETRTRRFCGALLRSPQKVLKGIAPHDDFESSPLRVCLEDGAYGRNRPGAGEPCGRGAICSHYRDVLREQGTHINCFGGVPQRQLPEEGDASGQRQRELSIASPIAPSESQGPKQQTSLEEERGL